MHWERRRGLEGGKQLGVWLLVDADRTVERELYVESYEYRGGNFDVYTATPDGDWEQEGAFESQDAAFARALAIIESTPNSLDSTAR